MQPLSIDVKLPHNAHIQSNRRDDIRQVPEQLVHVRRELRGRTLAFLVDAAELRHIHGELGQVEEGAYAACCGAGGEADAEEELGRERDGEREGWDGLGCGEGEGVDGGFGTGLRDLVWLTGRGGWGDVQACCARAAEVCHVDCEC
jgi:hypothetical protein